LEDFVTRGMLLKYLSQFADAKNFLINGKNYIDAIMERWWNVLS
jgi:hypothetical protein